MRRAPRIFIDARYLRGSPGGVATYTAELIKHLPALLPDVPFVLLRHPEAPAPLSSAPNVTERPLGGLPNNLWTYFRMGRWLEERLGPEDLFHAPYRILPRDVRPRSVLTMHDVMQVVCPELVFPNPVFRAIVTPYWSTAIRGSIRRAGRVISVSRHTADDTIRLDPEAASRVRVTPLGVDPSFRPMDEGVARRLISSMIPGGARFFLVLGGGYPNKNHTAAVAAFASAFAASDERHLLIIQRERTFPSELAEALRRTGLDERVHVRSRVSDEELCALYTSAEALLFPSLYEGFGLPVLEAMACGCPVVCSNLTSLPEVAGDAALLCDPRDVRAFGEAMRRVTHDVDLRRDRRARGLENAAKFSWTKTARQTIDVYREIAPWIPEPAR